MLYSCTYMAAVGVKGLTSEIWQSQNGTSNSRRDCQYNDAILHL